jgi:hypothetical protein
MGHEVVVYAHLEGGGTVVARVAPQPLGAAGDPVRLAFDLGKLHLFDGATGEAVRPRGPAVASA